MTILVAFSLLCVYSNCYACTGLYVSHVLSFLLTTSGSGLSMSDTLYAYVLQV